MSSSLVGFSPIRFVRVTYWPAEPNEGEPTTKTLRGVYQTLTALTGIECDAQGLTIPGRGGRANVVAVTPPNVISLVELRLNLATNRLEEGRP